jgi:hypothetical protein
LLANAGGLRLPTHGGLDAWEFEKGDRELKVRVEGQLVLRMNTATGSLGRSSHWIATPLFSRRWLKGYLSRLGH